MADQGSDNFIHDMELGMLTDEADVLEMIEEAVQRLIDGEYGKCLDCGCKIAEERLEAKPHARFCVKCKTMREQNSDTTG
jgi:DnaK suppressor protein